MTNDGPMREFWVSSGHHLVDHDEVSGGMLVTDDLLKAYFARPELAPPDEACMVERALHASLIAEPRKPVTAEDIALVADADARENWGIVIAFRDHLLRHASIEAAYIALVRGGMGKTPPLFVNQLAHLILRNALDAEDDAFVLRAAEIFFRPQLLSLHEGALLLADEEIVAGSQIDHHTSPLMSMLGTPAAAQLDILGDDNARGYRARSDAFDMVLDFRPGGRGRAAFARVVERWVAHLLGVSVKVEPVEKVEDQAWAWFVGLDAQATEIGNALWNGDWLPDEQRERVLALFRLRFEDPRDAIERVAGKPVYLILAVDGEKRLRVKPQNLVAGLPLARFEAAA